MNLAFHSPARTTGRTVLLIRRGALGDVLLTTPIINHLHALDPDLEIDIETDVPSVFENNPCVKNTVPFGAPRRAYDQVIDLDLCYERSPKIPVIDAYALCAFGHNRIDKSLRIYPLARDHRAVDDALRNLGLADHPLVVVHMARSWPNRTLPLSFWRRTAELLTCDLDLLLVGTDHDLFVSGPRIWRIGQRLTPVQLASLFERALCFVGPDSGLMHVASATLAPIVGIFTVARAELRIARNTRAGGPAFVAITPSVECYGCLHEQPAPATFCGCSRGDHMCLAQIHPEVVAEAVARLAAPRARELAASSALAEARS